MASLISRKTDFIVPLKPLPFSQTIRIATTCAVFLVCTWASVALRLYTRINVVRSIGWDDGWIVWTLMCFTIYCSCVIALDVIGAGVSSFSGELMNRITALLIMSEVFYTLSLISLKISLGIFFLRIMVDKYQKRLIWGVMISSTLVGIMLCFTAIFQCGFPVKSEVYWQRRIADNCLSKPAILGFNYTHGLVNIVTDILLCLSPIPIIRMARLYSREKLVIYGIFIIATMGCIGSIVRIFQVWVLVVDFLEFWFYIERIAVWSTVEVGFGITAACLATLRPLLRNIKKGIKSYRSHSDPSTVTKWSSKLTTMFSTSDETNPKSTTSTKGGGRNMKAFFANTTKMDTTFQGNDDFENQWVSYNQTPELDFPLERYSVVTTITGGKDEIAHRLNQPLPPLPTYASPKRQSSIPMPSGSSWKTADALIYGFTPKIEKRATWFPVLMSPAPEREDDGLK